MEQLLDSRDFEDIKQYFQFRNGNLSEEDKSMLSARIFSTERNRVALGGSCAQKRTLFNYGFYDKLIPDFHPYIARIIEIVEDDEKKEFEKTRPPGTSNKPLRRRLTNIILSFLASYYQSNREFWINDKKITNADLGGIAGACRAQIMVANRIAVNRAKNINHAVKKFFTVVKNQVQNRIGFTNEAMDSVQRIDSIIKTLQDIMHDKRSSFIQINQPIAEPDEDEEDDEFRVSDDEEEAHNGRSKQMTYTALVRNFSMHSEKIQKCYFEARQKLEMGFDYNQFVKVRNCLAYQFLLANSARSEVVTYLQWSEVEKASRVNVERHPDDDFVMVPFYDHKNQGRGENKGKKPLFLGMDRWMLFDLTYLRGFCLPGNKFVFPSGKASKVICKKGMNASRITNMMSDISGVEYKDHLHWIRSSATNASCISTEQSASQMVPDQEMAMLNGHSLQTAQKHYMKLGNNDRCIIAARAYVKLSTKRRTAFDEVEK